VVTRWLFDIVQLQREGKQDAVLSGAGGYLVFTRASGGNWSLAIQNLATGEAKELVRDTLTYRFIYPVIVSPDGGWIAYQSRRQNAPQWELAMIRSDGMDARVVMGHAGPNDPVEWAEPVAWSADGSALAVNLLMANGTHRLEIFSREGGSRRIAKTFDWRQPSGVGLSPDARFVAYAYQSNEEERARDLYVLALDGLRELRITDDEQVKSLVGWNVDGSALYYEVETFRNGRSVSSIWRLPMREGRPAGPPALIRDELLGNIEVGLDGERLILRRYPANSGSYMIVGLDLDEGQVVSPPEVMVWSEFGPGELRGFWTPDGREFAFSRPSQSRRAGWELVLHSLDSGDSRVIPLGISQANEMVPVDERTMVVRGRWREQELRMVQVDLPTGRVTEVRDPRLIALLDSPGNQYLTRARFSPDQSIMYFARQRDGAHDIVAREVATGTERVIHRTNDEIPYNFNPFPSPDGRQLAFLVRHSDPNGIRLDYHEVYVIPEAGGTPRLLHTGFIGGNSLNWSSDSRTVLFTDLVRDAGGGDGAVQVWMVDADGGRRAMLFIRRGLGIRPNLHPDSRRLLFRELDNAKESPEIWAIENLPESRAAARQRSPALAPRSH
jgi:Tol biopolymer transport system component